MSEVRKAIEVSGIVQGVGFRPFVYRLATELSLRGTICNTPNGVAIEVQGGPEDVQEFLKRLENEAPPLSHITAVEVGDVALRADDDGTFSIAASRTGVEPRALISPDIAICDDCLRELFDPADRRYRYPFINCTNCGPRFTIVRDIPYDRPRTSMAVFEMCAACGAEYEAPANRRFHAQPNACHECGPHVEWWNRDGWPVATDSGDALKAAAAALRAGQVIAVKGLGGFHLAADATNAAAVQRLRERKRRVEKPFAVMVCDMAAAERAGLIDDGARRSLTCPQRPIVLVPRRESSAIAEGVAPFNRYVGMFLPYTPLHHLLFAEGDFDALVMTSGNLSEEPIAIANDEAVARLAELADGFLVHNRDILLRCDDCVVQPVGGQVRQLRRSRGYVPVPVFLAEELPPVLAVGGELKNTICLTRGSHAFLSQHIGDLENYETYAFFQEAVSHLKQILEIEPLVIACDLHPDYLSTKWALQQSGVQRIGVQHHHAHIAACMAENHLAGSVIGIALDGTGYGADGRIWGGEILVADYAEFQRAGHLNYVPLPGGAAAIREPWRMAVSYLVEHFGSAGVARATGIVERVGKKRVEQVAAMVERRINAPLTSSCGRLFDAVASLAGVRDSINYEAQAAIELEMAIEDAADRGAYPFGVREEDGVLVLETNALFEALLNDLAAGAPAGVISARFHNGLALALANVAGFVRETTGLNRVCLSGGTFQNVYLAERLERLLGEAGFAVYTHAQVPAGDGGLALGQAVVAAHRVKRKSKVY